MLILKNYLSGLMDWWIELEDIDGNLYDLNWPGRPLVATPKQLDDFTNSLAFEANKNGGYLTFFHAPKGQFRTIKLKRIDTTPIKRAS